MDRFIKNSRRGLGGNTVPQRCIIVKQTNLNPDELDMILSGEYPSKRWTYWSAV